MHSRNSFALFDRLSATASGAKKDLQNFAETLTATPKLFGKKSTGGPLSAQGTGHALRLQYKLELSSLFRSKARAKIPLLFSVAQTGTFLA